jgi:hypothetical protein
VRIGTLLRIGVAPGLEHARRMRHDFEMWDDATARRVAAGFVRVGCVHLADFSPRDFPAGVHVFVDRIHTLAGLQSHAGGAVPWT